MLILEGRRFIESTFVSEEELEQVVVDHAELIFGPSAIYFPKKLISTADGAGTVPDGYVIDVAESRWYIVEAELDRHGVWRHIAPQVAKQIIAATNPASRQLLVDLAVTRLKEEPALLEQLEEQDIAEIDVRKVLGRILESDPIVGMPIDKVRSDLREWAQTLRVPVKLWEVRKYEEFGNSGNVIYELPEEYRPTLDTIEPRAESRSMARYDITLSDLLEADLLAAGEVLEMPYKPRGGERKVYRASVVEDGELEVLGKRFTSPSYAALLGIQDAGSSRTTVNGWVAWRNKRGRSLADLREEYLASDSSI
ncbi:MAG TPA: hypothetical protein VNB06_21030 [Thermoanaerobaculia bacterium]|nr:hypothetical protein [Thermoanaerobaculia bacterium]